MFPLSKRDIVRHPFTLPVVSAVVFAMLVAATVWHAFPASGVEGARTRPMPAVVFIAPAANPAAAHTDKPAAALKPMKPVEPKCSNELANILESVGFRGKNHKEAWAIAMRESRGNADVISSTNDYGLFQFNRAAHNSQPWWDSKKLLTAEYNATVAFEMSRGGKTWYPWGLDGQGRTKAHIYQSIGWSQSKIASHITDPYRKFVAEYEDLPKQCRTP